MKYTPGDLTLTPKNGRNFGYAAPPCAVNWGEPVLLVLGGVAALYALVGSVAGGGFPPHKEFWAGVPALVKDGGAFAKAKLTLAESKRQARKRRKKGDYKEVSVESGKPEKRASSSSKGRSSSSGGGESGGSGGSKSKSSSSSKLKAGDRCEYFSSSKKEWLPAKVKKVRSGGEYDLDVKDKVAKDKVRARK